MFNIMASGLLLIALCFSAGAQSPAQPAPQHPSVVAESRGPKVEFEYKFLATNRTSTMEKEMNEAASAGYQFAQVISGETFFGGSEALVVMVRAKDAIINLATITSCLQPARRRRCRRNFRKPGTLVLSTAANLSLRRRSAPR